MNVPLELIVNFRELYKTEIAPALNDRNYLLASLLIHDPATAMREDWQNLTSKFHFALGLAAKAYGFSQALEKYIRNPSESLEEDIKDKRELLEMAIAQSKLPI